MRAWPQMLRGVRRVAGCSAHPLVSTTPIPAVWTFSCGFKVSGDTMIVLIGVQGRAPRRLGAPTAPALHIFSLRSHLHVWQQVCEGVRLVGWVSRASSGVKSGDASRQFFFVNGRPVDLPRAAKALNEAFRCGGGGDHCLNLCTPTFAQT